MFSSLCDVAGNRIYDCSFFQPSVQSSVVSTEKKITKNQVINAQNVDEKGKAR